MVVLGSTRRNVSQSRRWVSSIAADSVLLLVRDWIRIDRPCEMMGGVCKLVGRRKTVKKFVRTIGESECMNRGPGLVDVSLEMRFQALRVKPEAGALQIASQPNQQSNRASPCTQTAYLDRLSSPHDPMVSFTTERGIASSI
jgi:hypothetical protein